MATKRLEKNKITFSFAQYTVRSKSLSVSVSFSDLIVAQDAGDTERCTHFDGNDSFYLFLTRCFQYILKIYLLRQHYLDWVVGSGDGAG